MADCNTNFCYLSVTMIANERSFSMLKVIKTYLMTSMGQERLNAPAVISIENYEARWIDWKS